jgi:hypothetical protein
VRPEGLGNRNEYQKIFLESKVWPVPKADNFTTRLSRNCGILDISQPSKPPWPLRWKALLLLMIL